MSAVAKGDKITAKFECDRNYTDKQGVKRLMLERNKGTREFIDQSESWNAV